jgi:hypothetical protein
VNSCFPKRNGLVERRDTQPARTFRFQCPRTLDGTVSVGVGLYDGADRHGGAYMLLNSAEVLPQDGERNIGPGRPGRDAAQDFCCSGHFGDYSGWTQNAEVTQGLLLRSSEDSNSMYREPEVSESSPAFLRGRSCQPLGGQGTPASRMTVWV